MAASSLFILDRDGGKLIKKVIWKFSVFSLSIAYAIVLWFAYSNPASFIWPGTFFFFFLIASVKLISRKYFYSILPVLLFVGSILLLPLIDSASQAKVFILLTAAIFYLAILGGYRLGKYEKDQTAKAMLNLTALTAVFCWFVSSYGWYLNIELPVWFIMIVFAIVAFLSSYASFRINQININAHQRILYSVFLAYLMAGTIWVQDFWPFGYLTTGVIALIIYYSGWHIISSYFLEKLTLRKLFFNIIFLVGATSIILFSTRWYPFM